MSTDRENGDVVAPEDGMLTATVRCPKCGCRMPDHDGFGFIHCAACGHCTHPARDDGKCTICGHVENGDPGVTGEKRSCLTCGRQMCDRQPEDNDPEDCADWKAKIDIHPAKPVTGKKQHTCKNCETECTLKNSMGGVACSDWTPAPPPETCKWIVSPYHRDYRIPSCRPDVETQEIGVVQDWKVCPYCGKRIEVVRAS